MATIEDFMALDIRVGVVRSVRVFPQARQPAYQLQVDFGPDIGIKPSSAQITELYQPEDLEGRQVLAVVNFPPRQIGSFRSDVLVLGVYSDGGVVLIGPERPVMPGDRLG